MDRMHLSYSAHRVIGVDIRWGLSERPLWRTLEALHPNVAVKWVDRFSPFEAIAAEWALAAVFESAHRIEVPERAQALRSIYLELQRVFWGFNFMSELFYALGDQIRYQKAMRLRELMFEMQDILTGNRVLPQIFSVGGVERDLSVGENKKLKSFILDVNHHLTVFFRDLGGDTVIAKRLTGVLPITSSWAHRISLRGALGQASGLIADLRIQTPMGLYSSVGIRAFDWKSTQDWSSLKTPVQGDVHSRLRSVLFQIRQSLSLIDMFLGMLPDGEFLNQKEIKNELPPGTWVRAVESATGPLYAILHGGEIRIFSQSMRLREFLPELLLGVNGDDFEIALASLGFDFEQADLCGKC